VRIRGLNRIKRFLGWDQRNWLRIAQIESWVGFLADLRPSDLLEISPGWNSMWSRVPNTRYTSVHYPQFDISEDLLDRTFDVIVADQVLEHVASPVAAVANIRQMLCPGGWAMIATPFLFRVHARPHDYYRWTEAGLRRLLLDGGFEEGAIRCFSWGNRECARAHIGGEVKPFGFGRPLHNDPEYPMMVWAFAQRISEGSRH
jgi:SAM-dependent methyltransferase